MYRICTLHVGVNVIIMLWKS